LRIIYLKTDATLIPHPPTASFLQSAIDTPQSEISASRVLKNPLEVRTVTAKRATIAKSAKSIGENELK
jgi:hypothetical protein